jgi:predicted hotdog family 3-hydroxylacyl-ACP dehydratase
MEFSQKTSPPTLDYRIAELLPQSGGMVLLDRVLDAGENHLTAELTVREDGLFSGPDHTVPAWVGMEYMAQTVAAYSGYQRKLRGQAIELGFLLGTRYYQCSVGGFPCGILLCVRVEKAMQGANGMSVFDCSIEGENISASSTINVMMPQDVNKFLAGKGL